MSPSAGARADRLERTRASVSDRLLAYPKNLLAEPARRRRRRRRRSCPARRRARRRRWRRRELLEQRAAVRAVGDSGFARLIVHDDLGAWFVVASLFIAFFWGAAHGLGPGPRQVDRRRVPGRLARHGPACAAARRDGDGHAHDRRLRARPVTLSLSQFIVPEQLYPWLNLVSALLIVGVGVSRAALARRRVAPRAGARARAPARHAHDHDHGHAARP